MLIVDLSPFDLSSFAPKQYKDDNDTNEPSIVPPIFYQIIHTENSDGNYWTSLIADDLH